MNECVREKIAKRKIVSTIVTVVSRLSVFISGLSRGNSTSADGGREKE